MSKDYGHTWADVMRLLQPSRFGPFVADRSVTMTAGRHRGPDHPAQLIILAASTWIDSQGGARHTETRVVRIPYSRRMNVAEAVWQAVRDVDDLARERAWSATLDHPLPSGD